MNLSKIEQKILQQLTANGAATVHELTEAIACSLSGVQNGMRTLRAAGMIRAHDLKHVPGFYKRVRTYVANMTQPTVGATVEANPLLDRVVKLEEAFKNLTEIHNRMVMKSADRAKNLSQFGGKVEQLDRWFHDHEVWLTVLDDRIRALEPAAAPEVDPAYAKIEAGVRERLGHLDFDEDHIREVTQELYELRNLTIASTLKHE